MASILTATTCPCVLFVALCCVFNRREQKILELAWSCWAKHRWIFANMVPIFIIVKRSPISHLLLLLMNGSFRCKEISMNATSAQIFVFLLLFMIWLLQCILFIIFRPAHHHHNVGGAANRFRGWWCRCIQGVSSSVLLPSQKWSRCDQGEPHEFGYSFRYCEDG